MTVKKSPFLIREDQGVHRTLTLALAPVASSRDPPWVLSAGHKFAHNESRAQLSRNQSPPISGASSETHGGDDDQSILKKKNKSAAALISRDTRGPWCAFWIEFIIYTPKEHGLGAQRRRMHDPARPSAHYLRRGCQLSARNRWSFLLYAGERRHISRMTSNFATANTIIIARSSREWIWDACES